MYDKRDCLGGNLITPLISIVFEKYEKPVKKIIKTTKL